MGKRYRNALFNFDFFLISHALKPLPLSYVTNLEIYTELVHGARLDTVDKVVVWARAVIVHRTHGLYHVAWLNTTRRYGHERRCGLKRKK